MPVETRCLTTVDETFEGSHGQSSTRLTKNPRAQATAALGRQRILVTRIFQRLPVVNQTNRHMLDLLVTVVELDRGDTDSEHLAAPLVKSLLVMAFLVD